MAGATKQVEFKERKERIPEYKLDFIKALYGAGALKIGSDKEGKREEYKLKSGRESTYFANVGGMNSGSDTNILARAYANAIAADLKGKLDNIYIFGIPEKGVALAPTISMALAEHNGIESNWFFNRKGGEKQHGEATSLSQGDLGKLFLGSVPEVGKRILIVDDVLTTGGAKEEAVAMLKKLLPGREIVGIVIAVDRQEVGADGKSAVKEFTEKTGIPVYPIINATDIVQYMEERVQFPMPVPPVERKRLEDGVTRASTYIRVYGSDEARKFVAQNVPSVQVLAAQRSIIPACDTTSIEVFEELVRQTSKVEGIGGYKIGFTLGLSYGLPKVVEVARKYAPDKPLIYDHQKAATDIPDTAKDFMKVVKSAGIDSVILFPHTGPETERAWIYRAMENNLGVIVGGIMTHNAYLVSEGGFIKDEAALEIYRIAARAGVTNFVVPGTKPAKIKMAKEAVEAEGVLPVFLAPGMGPAQGGKMDEVRIVLGPAWHAIVGRKILQAEKGDYATAAKTEVEELLRVAA